MAGALLAAMRWAPEASWLVAGPEFAHLSAEALRWLLSTRAPGVWATLPLQSDAGGPEPRLAHYDFRAARLLAELAERSESNLALIASSGKVSTPSPPAEIAGAWKTRPIG